METDRERLTRIYAEKKQQDIYNGLDYKQKKRRDYYLANREKLIAKQLERYSNKENKKEYYQNNKEKYKKYYEDNKIDILEQRRAHYPKVKEKHLERNRIWRVNNKNKIKAATLRKKEKKQTEYWNKQKLFLLSL